MHDPPIPAGPPPESSGPAGAGTDAATTPAQKPPLEPRSVGSTPAIPPLLGAGPLAQFGRGDAVVFDDVLGAVAARTVAAGLRAHGFELRPASVGRQTVRVQDDSLRSDSTCWLEPNVPAAASPLWGMFSRLGEQLRARAWLGPLDVEMQLACFPALAPGYARHRDAFQGRGRRRATAIWYMHADRAATDGGELRTYGPDGPRDLEPRFDRLVLFDAGALEHAVLPCRAARWAVTAWFLGPERA